ncbi:MAG TPA: ABC transporter ATP-binding protein [Bacillus sp. (in: firmicutes)]|nr:ABC transporter ATP-binding protein [Bacillus sp. (in: firmicutes)]
MGIGASMEVKNVTKYYKNNFKAVDNVSLSIKKGEFLTILGPSGSGKTSLLKLIAGFESLSEGKIELNNEDISKKEPYLRNVGMLFQNYALFPHMTVYDNVAYPLKIRKMGKEDIRKKVSDILDLVHLTDFSNRYPGQLSGGQQQRVALARAIVFNPPLLLLDEPLGALDKQLRQNMQLEIKRIQETVGITTISVTHDQEEALTMSDRICVMKEGRVVQVDTPDELYRRPANHFVAEFIGEINLLEGTVNEVSNDRISIKLNEETVSLVELNEKTNNSGLVGSAVSLAVRPEDIRISEESGTFDTEFNVTVTDVIYVGESLKVKASSPFNKELTIKVPSYSSHKVKENTILTVGWNYNNATYVRDESQAKEREAS